MGKHDKKCGSGAVAHTCNPSYSGGRGQKDQSSNPAQANSFRDPTLKYPSQKKGAGGVAQGVGPEFKPQYSKNTHTYVHYILMQIFVFCFVGFFTHFLLSYYCTGGTS
jgi:hypothetical protein